jgi:hypothetical protein
VGDTIDGQTTTKGGLDPVIGSYITYEFTQPVDLHKIRVLSVTGSNWSIPKGINLYFFDAAHPYGGGSPIVYTPTALANTVSWQDVDLTATGYDLSAVQYVKIKVTSSYAGSLTIGGFKEIEFYGSDAINLTEGSDHFVLAKSSPSVSGSGSVPTDAFDGNSSTFHGFETLYGSSYELYFKQPATLDRIDLTGYAQSGWDSPKKIEAWVNDDTGHDVSVGTFTMASGEATQHWDLTTPALNVTKLKLKVESTISGGTTASGGFREIAAFGQRPETLSFSLTSNSLNKTIEKSNFMAQGNFYFPGLKFGTASGTANQANRDTFATKLSNAGIKGLRFPGGTYAHYYMSQGKSYTDALKLAFDSAVNSNTVGVGYDPTKSFHSDNYVTLEDYLKFCAEKGLDAYYVVNTSHYYDKDAGRVKAITRTKMNTTIVNGNLTYVKDAGGNNIWDGGDHYYAASLALGDEIDRLVAEGLTLPKYWELGNEEFHQYNYQPGVDTQAAARYANTAANLAHIIRQKVPNAIILMTSGGESDTAEHTFMTQVLDEMRTNHATDYSNIDYVTFHYPYQLKNTTTTLPSDPDYLDEFAGTDQGFSVDLNNAYDIMKGVSPDNDNTHDYTADGIKMAVTETLTWQWSGDGQWDNYLVDPSFAGGLQESHNWGQLVFETPSTINNRLSMEQPYFGTLMYSVGMDSTTRHFSWHKPDGSWTPALPTGDSVPSQYDFTDEYFITPDGKINNWLAESIGGKVMDVNVHSTFQDVSLFAVKEGTVITVYIINTTPDQKTVDMDLSNVTAVAGSATKDIYKANMSGSYKLGGVISAEYSTVSTTQSVAASGITAMTVDPYSFTKLKITTTN